MATAREWYVTGDPGNDLELGPLSSSELKQLASDGRVTAQTWVKLGDDGKWVRAQQVKGLFAAARSPLPRAQPFQDESRSREGESDSIVAMMDSTEPPSRAGEIRREELPSESPAHEKKPPAGPIPELAGLRTCEFDTPVWRFLCRTPFGFLTALGLGTLVLSILLHIMNSNFDTPDRQLGAKWILAGFIISVGMWVWLWCWSALEGRKVACPRCKKWFAIAKYNEVALKVGEGRTTIPSSYQITTADGRPGGYIDGFQQVGTDIMAVQWNCICKFCGCEWEGEGTRQIIR